MCLASESACPPEEVAGISGYEHFIAIINDKNNEERKEFLEWVSGKYDPETFNKRK